MKWSKHYDMYFDEIKEAIQQYAFENYIYDPIIGNAVLPEREWFGQIFNVSDIDTLLHSGIMDIIKTNGFLQKVYSKGFDKFIITPDVFSENDVPTKYPHNNEFDLDRRQLIYMNDRLFEVIDNRDWKSLKFNYNGKTYIFFPGNKQGTIVDGSSSKMEIIDFKEYSFIDEDPSVDDLWDESSKLLLKFSENRKLFINDEVPSEDHVMVGVRHPYLVYSYENDFNDEHIKENPRLKIYGLKSFNKDMNIMEKPVPYDDRDKLMIHDRSVLMSSTAIIIYKDKSFVIENFKNPINKSIIERYDKHTIYVHKDDNIDKIIILLHPVGVSKLQYRVDTLYDKITAHSSKAFMLLSRFSKNTNILLETMLKNDKMSMEEFIEFGYRYDRDVLKIIQSGIPSYITLKMDAISVRSELHGNKFYRPKVVVRVHNRINGFPQLIINGKMVCEDYKIIKHNGVDWLILDPIRTFSIHKDDINLNFLNNYISKNISSIEVVFLTDSYYDTDHTSLRPFRVLSNPTIHKRIHQLDTYIGNADDSMLFLNGRLTYSGFVNKQEYILNYGVHRVPINKNMYGNEISEFYNWDTSTHNASNVGFTSTNKSINILNTDKSDSQFMLDITKETNINRRMMILNLGSGANVNYTIFNNVEVRDPDGFVNTIELPEFEDSIAPGRTVFFDYDGYVVKPNILTEQYIDPKFISLYSHTKRTPNINISTGEGFGPRNNDSFCVHYINLGHSNAKYDLDLNIDDSLVHLNNYGSYNENCMKDMDVRNLFKFYKKDANKTPIETYCNDYNQLYNMKLYMSFWYSHNNYSKLLDTPEFQKVITSNPTLFNSNGTPKDDKFRILFPLNEEFKIEDGLYGIDVGADICRRMMEELNMEYIADEFSIDSSNKNNVLYDEKYKYCKSLDVGTINIFNVFSTRKL